MPNPVKTLVQDDGWVHLSLGLAGNISFLCGSILFLPGVEPDRTIGVWCFITGSGLMLIGALGRLLVELWMESPGLTSRNAREGRG